MSLPFMCLTHQDHESRDGRASQAGLNLDKTNRYVTFLGGVGWKGGRGGEEEGGGASGREVVTYHERRPGYGFLACLVL